MSITTSIGRVQPLYKGDYSTDTTYFRLDNVYHNGATWVCTAESVLDVTPNLNNPEWQLVSAKGDKGDQGVTGSFGTPSASANTVSYESGASASVVATGDDTAKIFTFTFDIPAGPRGFGDVTARASSVEVGNPSARASLIGVGANATLSFEFDIPKADGQGVKFVDGIGPTGTSDNVYLYAVSYERNQTIQGENDYINPAQQSVARNNINAMVKPSSYVVGEYLRYNGDGQWGTHSVDVFPAQGATGQYLRKAVDGPEWAPVYSIPPGGAANAVLTKTTNQDYNCAWTIISAISSSDIDSIMGN